MTSINPDFRLIRVQKPKPSAIACGRFSAPCWFQTETREGHGELLPGDDHRDQQVAPVAVAAVMAGGADQLH